MNTSRVILTAEANRREPKLPGCRWADRKTPTHKQNLEINRIEWVS